jgi:sugar/nucleoside kinase (ribokinase family)
MVLSVEDLAGDLDIARAIATRLPVLAVTRGSDGCSVYRRGRVADVPAYSAMAADTVGAGDVFAAAFFIRLGETDHAVESACFASAAAAWFVEGAGASRIPDREAIGQRRLGEGACIE